MTDRRDVERAAPWPLDHHELEALQTALGDAADRSREEALRLPHAPLLGGCFVAFARGEAGPGHAGDQAWAAAVTWRPSDGPRDEGAALRGTSHAFGPRVANDLHEQVVVDDAVPAAYRPGLLAEREGPILEAAVRALVDRPDVLLVDATGADHPRRAGLAIHLGWVLGLPTVGVTHRTLHAPATDQPPRRRGTRVPIDVAGETVAHWVHTTDTARPVVAHAGWRTDAAGAADVTLLASTATARTPVPLAEARRAAREARAIAGGEWG